MDEQRLNEIAKSAAAATIDTVFHLPDTMDRFRAILEESAYRAVREALASQEEERDAAIELKRIALAELRGYQDGFEGLPHSVDELRYRFDTSQEDMAYRMWFGKGRAARVVLVDAIDVLGRRNGEAEAELQRLREGMRQLQRYICDCLPNDPTNSRMATDEEAAHADVLSCQRFVVLDADVERFLASSVEEKRKPDDEGWSCVECGTFVAGTSIDLSTAACKCGIGRGRWGACMRPLTRRVASDVLGTMDSEGPFVEPPGRPTSC
jgi:hypothetical protein